ncbi:MAG: hypothetical protein KDK41_09060 [Leptospiraceae bacterium]|nr:hypothetical protein [Leptospiraceae bacterium]
MAIRPLDLQVNINALLEITKHEGDRHSREEIQRRSSDKKIAESASRKVRSVTPAEEAEIRPDLKDTHPHFGELTEQEIAYREHSRQLSHQQGSTDSDEQEKKSQNQNSEQKKPDSDHLLDILA